jgi:NAD-dependent SIR2 family protein deacetylase
LVEDSALQGTAETFVCVECERRLTAEQLAYDTDSEQRLGVCTGCEPALTEAQARPAWIGREVA